ncbi:hypothetical protein ACHAWF_014373 [Thalassiosira exigua]
MSFNIGSSGGGGQQSSMDMALDDVIKSRRSDKSPRRTARKNAGQRGPTAAARVTGQNKARRTATMAAKRGIAQSGKPNAMEVEKQVNRQQKRGVGKMTGALKSGRVGGPRSNAGRRATAPSAASVRAKARNLAGVRAQKSGQQSGGSKSSAGGTIQAPSHQAIGAAARAMKERGFKPPKGMQMQISFVPKAGANDRNVGTQKKGNQNNYNNNNAGRGAGRGGRGGRGGGRGGRGRGGRQNY